MKSFDELMAEQNEAPEGVSLGLIYRDEDSSISVLDVSTRRFGKIECDASNQEHYNSMADSEVEIAMIKCEGENTQVRPLFRIKTPQAACFYVKEHWEDPAFMQVVGSGAHLLKCAQCLESMPPEAQAAIKKVMKGIQGAINLAKAMPVADDFDASCN